MPILTHTQAVDHSNARDDKTEVFLWQRTLFFRPWYRDARVVELGCRDGRYLRYAAPFATEAVGFDNEPRWVDTANRAHTCADFRFTDFATETIDADVVLAFELIEELPDPRAFLGWLSGQKVGS